MSTLLSSTEGLIALRLTPTPESADVLDQLHAALHSATRLRAAVAWVSGYEDLDLGLIATKTAGEGFLCVDIRKPTNLDWLLELHEAGGQVRLNLRRPIDGRGEPTLPIGLLHSKVLLMDRVDDTAEIWVGSHNWSRRALTGPNIETSVVMTVSASGPTYAEVTETLRWVAGVCERFDPHLMHRYRELQGEEQDGEPAYLVKLYTSGADALERQVFTLFGADLDDLEAVPSIGRGILVELTELGRNEARTLFDARLLHSGFLAGAERAGGGLSFAARRYAWRESGGRRAQLQEAGEVPAHLIQRGAYFLTIEIRAPAPVLTYYESMERSSAWTASASDPLLDRMRPERRDRGGGRKPVRVGVPSDSVSNGLVLSQREMIALGGEPLVTRVRVYRGPR